MVDLSLGDASSADVAQQALRSSLGQRIADEAFLRWLDEAGADPSALRETGRAGKRALVGSFAERAGATLPGTWGTVPCGEWRVDVAARVYLLARWAEASETPYTSLFNAYDAGDTTTREAALRALNFVRQSDPAQGLELVLDAGRTYLSPLLLAAWSGNPFSSKNLNQHDFRKAVLKAFFCEVPVDGVLGLEARADETLAKSMCEFMDERLAAGRTVPRALWAIAAFYPQPGLVARLVGNLEHPDALERRVAALALGRTQDPRSESFLTERLTRESDPTVLQAIETALERLKGSS